MSFKTTEKTTMDLSRLLCVSKSTILRWIQKYNLPCEITPGGHSRFTDEQIKEIKQILKHKWGLES